MVAYLDAGTGSMVIGAVAAGVAGAGVALRSTVGRFRRKGKSDSSPAAESEQQGVDEVDTEDVDEVEPETQDADEVH